MSTFTTFLLILIVVLLGLAGYYYLDRVAPLQTSYQELKRQNQELLFEVGQLEQRNATISKRLEAKVRELSEEKRAEIEKLKTTYDDLIEGLKEEVQKGEITITRLADQLNVKIVDSIIFPSGKAELSPDGIRVLQQVGGILKKAKDKRIRVEGHTDNVPIHPKLQKKFPTNWELSVARATNVVRFLQDEVGIDPHNLEVAGLGENRPVATNETRKGRMQNRRIEILLLPSGGNTKIAGNSGGK